jgi:cytochrome c556
MATRRLLFGVAALMALCALSCLQVACGGNSSANEPGNEPEKTSLFWDDQRGNDWIYRNQYKTTMRTMWVACGKLVTLHRGEAKPDYALMEGYAKDISRRADRLATHWESFARPGQNVLDAVKDKDWLLANAELEEFGKACDNCHLDTWAPIYQHVTREIAAGWVRNEVPPRKEVLLNEGKSPPAVENRAVMNALLAAHDNGERALKNKDGEVLIAAVRTILGVAQERATLWRNLKNAADAFAALCANKEREGLKAAYESMTANCRGCHKVHAQFTEPNPPPRPILDPMPWD